MCLYCTAIASETPWFLRLVPLSDTVAITAGATSGSVQVVDNMNHQLPNAQYGLNRLFLCVFMVAVICSLFATFEWPFALLFLSGMNAAASLRFWVAKRWRIANATFATSCLILATLFFTDWGLSTPHPVIRIAWKFLVGACLMQLYAIVTWLFLVPPHRDTRREPGSAPACDGREAAGAPRDNSSR